MAISSPRPSNESHGGFPFAGAAAGRDATGFTIIELVVTIIVVGIMAVVILPKFDTLGDFDARGYTDQLKSVLRYAQKTAIAQRRQVLVGYSRSSVTICSEPHATAPTCPASVSCSVGGRTPVALPGGTFRAGPASITATGAVCFNALGEAYGGSGGINLDGVAGAEINVVAATGYVY